MSWKRLMPKRLTKSRPTTWAWALALSGGGTRWSKATTIFSGSATFRTSRQYSVEKLLSNRTAVSTLTTTKSPGLTFGTPPARASIFSTMVIAMRARYVTNSLV